jgi:NifU-like protein involved in Fe-S cluster formation
MAAGMNAPLYTTEILRLAASIPEATHLERVDAKAEERSPTCGSSIRIEVQLADDGSIAALSQQVHACAFGQASAALLARNAVGRGRADIAAALLELGAWLSGDTDRPVSWPGFEALAPARPRKSRHGAILLPFRAVLAAFDGTSR